MRIECWGILLVEDRKRVGSRGKISKDDSYRIIVSVSKGRKCLKKYSD